MRNTDISTLTGKIERLEKINQSLERELVRALARAKGKPAVAVIELTAKELYEKQKLEDRINSLWHEGEHLKELLETANHTIHTLVHKYNIHTP